VRRRQILRIVVASVIVLVVGYVLAVWYEFSRLGAEMRHNRRQLFFHTDYQALLEACRELSARLATGELEARRYAVRPEDGQPWLELPPMIMQLDPSFVDLDDRGRVSIDLGRFISRFGVTAYPEDYEVPFASFTYGSRELIPGLWYYDPDYDLNAEYRKKIDAMIDEAARPIPARSPRSLPRLDTSHTTS
jgi:hypothetical protein